MKLIEKTRIGSKVIKRYDKPKTPYRRIMEENKGKVPEEVKQKLGEQYDKIDPIELKEEIDKLQKRLYDLYVRKQKEGSKHLSSNIPNNSPMKQSDFVYNLSEATRGFKPLFNLLFNLFCSFNFVNIPAFLVFDTYSSSPGNNKFKSVYV